MQGFIFDDVVLDWITSLAQRARYASLHWERPVTSDPTASELVDAGYSRQQITWEVLSNRTIGNVNLLLFSTSLTSSAAAIGLHEELTSTSMLAFAAPPLNVISATPGGFLILERGSLVLGFN